MVTDYSSWTNNYSETFNNKLNTLGDYSSKSKVLFITKGLFEICKRFKNKLMSADNLKRNPTASAGRKKTTKKRSTNLFIEHPIESNSIKEVPMIISEAKNPIVEKDTSKFFGF